MQIIKDMDSVVNLFLEGKVGVFATDTVWGAGCSLNNEEAIKRLYQIKKRKKDKPTAVLVADYKQAKELGQFNKEAEELVKRYWPGALTVIVPVKGRVTTLVTDKNRKVGLRAPNNRLLFKVLKKAGPIVATSANFVGERPPTKKEEIDKVFLRQVDFLVEGGEPVEGLASTVLDTMVKPFKVLRQGSVDLCSSP